MKQTHYLQATVKEGNRLDISFPTLPVGETIEVILIVPETSPETAQVSNPLSSENLDVKQLAKLATEFAEEDSNLSEAGINDYATMLKKEDNL